MELENPSRLATVAAVVAALLAVVVFAPLALVSGVGPTLGAYYAAGPFGLTAVGFIALLTVVVFLSVDQAHTDTLLLSGAGLVVAVVALLFAVVWVLTLDETVLFSFPTEYAWIETHRWVVLAVAGVLAAVAGAQTRVVL